MGKSAILNGADPPPHISLTTLNLTKSSRHKLSNSPSLQ